MLFGKAEDKTEKSDMFDMEQIGRNLMAARKNAGMTQMELADRMGISFQAVSNWERGVSCPDISKLSELSDLFGVTIDFLLGNQRAAELIRQAEQEAPALTPEEFESVAPLLSQEQADRAAEGTVWDIASFASAIPFLSSEFIGKVAREKYKETGRLEDLILLYPFLSEGILYALVNETFEKQGNLETISQALPFLRVDHAEELAMKVYRSTAELGAVHYALPFLSQKCVKALAKEEFEKTRSLEAVNELFPFMNSHDLEALVLEAMNK